jgi:hypothetical protein
MIEAEEDRFDRLLKLAPCRFHISDDPRLGVGLVMRCQVNNDNEDGPKFFTQRDGIRNCKPGIWTSLRRHVANDDPDNEYEVEYILRWVASGTIDISQPLKEWEEYEKSTREADAQVKLSQIVPRGVKWRRNGTYFSDDGICAVISSEYLTSEAAANIQFGRAEEIDEYNYGGYLEFLSPPGFGPGQGDSGGFTIGGVKCKHTLGIFCLRNCC